MAPMFDRAAALKLDPRKRVARAVELAATWPATTPQGDYLWWLRYWGTPSLLDPDPPTAPGFPGALPGDGAPVEQLPLFTEERP